MNRLLQFFEYSHLPEHLQEVSKPFGELAKHLDATFPSNAETTVAIRKLLEAKGHWRSPIHLRGGTRQTHLRPKHHVRATGHA